MAATYRTIPILQEAKSYSPVEKVISYTGVMDRVRELIIKKADDLGTSLAELSRGMDRSHAYLQQFIKRGIPASLPEDSREALAPLIGVKPDELRPDNSPRALAAATSPAIVTRPPPKLMGNRDLPIYSAAEGGKGTLIISTDVIEYRPRPYNVQGISDAYGIVIEGESMIPAYWPGDVAWVNPRFPAARETDVIIYDASKEGERRASIKRLIGINDTSWTLRQWNPKKDFKLNRGQWWECHRVVGRFARR